MINSRLVCVMYRYNGILYKGLDYRFWCLCGGVLRILTDHSFIYFVCLSVHVCLCTNFGAELASLALGSESVCKTKPLRRVFSTDLRYKLAEEPDLGRCRLGLSPLPVVVF